MKGLPLQFLLPHVEHEGDKVLVVQSAEAWRFVQALELLRERYPKSSFTALIRRGLEGDIPRSPDVEYLVSEGPKPSFVRKLRARWFDRAFVLFANDPGFPKLKLLPFALNVGAIYAINENLDWFPVDLRNTKTLAQHLRMRLESSVTFSGGAVSPGVEKLAKAAVYPATLAYLLAYEQMHHLSAKLRGVGPWKRENSPRAHRGRS